MSDPACKYLPRLIACSEEENKKLFSLNDPGTHNTVCIDVNTRHCRKVKIDGALNEVTPNKCDWCIWDYRNNDFLFVELKGRDFEHAAVQLECTIRWFLKNITPFNLYKETYIVMNRHCGIPSCRTIKQKSARVFVKEFKTVLKCTHSGHTLYFSQQ